MLALIKLLMQIIPPLIKGYTSWQESKRAEARQLARKRIEDSPVDSLNKFGKRLLTPAEKRSKAEANGAD